MQLLVVRKGEREVYSRLHGGSYIIVTLPEKIRFTYKAGGVPLDLGVTTGRIGYARLFCQLLAHSLKLPEIWMLDDNVRRW